MAPGMMMVHDNPNTSYWSMEKGYTGDSNGKEYPYSLLNSEELIALTVVFQIEESDLEYLCSTTFLGYKIFLTMPGETLKASRYTARIPLSELSQLSMKPKLITTSEGMRGYHPNQRQCFYNSERQLRFFRNYSQSNCEAECLANFTKLECGCVKFHMPSIISYFAIRHFYSTLFSLFSTHRGQKYQNL